MKRLITGAWLTTMWVLLWGGPSVADIAGGVVASAVLLTLFPDTAPRRRYTVRPVAAVRFAVFFLVKLVEANLVLAWEIITPWNKIREGIVAVPIRHCGPGVVTAIANSISLTPGTLTLEVDPEHELLYVHVLHLRDLEAVRHDLLRFVEMIVRAFGSAEALAAVTTAEDGAR